MTRDPITYLPDNAYLPDNVHQLADKWREAVRRVADLERRQAEGREAVRTAEHAYATALRSAAVADGPLPGGESVEDAKADLADITPRIPHARAEQTRLARELVVQLRTDTSRAYVAERVAASLRPALEVYRQVLVDAEETVGRAAAALTPHLSLLGIVEALDTGKPVFRHDVHPVAPSFLHARRGVSDIAQRLAGLSERTRPQQRRVRRVSDGRVMTVTHQMAADMVRDLGTDGVQFMDGWPAERPSHPIPHL
ncbi:hypothetical protein GCM10009551_022210 [Nocardiopsis tropica]|uniref:hypothetical protein n=1 Tax=Nocardiopsis tropica TaxID=109330 RepID=UPI0031D27F82